MPFVTETSRISQKLVDKGIWLDLCKQNIEITQPMMLHKNI